MRNLYEELCDALEHFTLHETLYYSLMQYEQQVDLFHDDQMVFYRTMDEVSLRCDPSIHQTRAIHE